MSFLGHKFLSSAEDRARLSQRAASQMNSRPGALRTGAPYLCRGFTLIELMIVVGIMGIILTIAVPGIYRQLHPNPLQKGVDEIREACKAARELAVLGSSTTMLSIDLKNRSFSGGNKSFQLSDRVIIEGVGINGLDYTEDEHAEVRFYPKGTSDEFSIVLRYADNQELRNIWLDAVTGYPEFEVDPRKFRHR